MLWLTWRRHRCEGDTRCRVVRDTSTIVHLPHRRERSFMRELERPSHAFRNIGPSSRGYPLMEYRTPSVQRAARPAPPAARITAARHRGYAFQWYSLSALTAILLVLFTFMTT